MDLGPRRTRLFAAHLGLLLVVGLLTWSLPASAAPDGVSFGARLGPRGGENDRDAVARVEDQAGRQLDVLREFLEWDSPFPESFHSWIRDSDRTMLLSVKSIREDGSYVRWADIVAAAPGSPLYAEMVGWADRIKDYGRPIYFTYNHEPESKKSLPMGNATEYIAAWRRLYDLFAARGVTNAKFLWIMTDYSFFVGPQAPNDASKWYPGDDYLEAMGVDAYNWYTCRDGKDIPWWSLETIIEPFRDFGAAHPDEELWVTEWASTEDLARPERKAEWIAQAGELFKRPDYAQFRGVSYFDYRGPDECEWFVDSSETSLSAFHDMATDPFYGGDGEPPPPPPPPSVGVSLVGVDSDNRNARSHSVQVPGGVQAGDTLLLFFTGNANPESTVGPQGWVLGRSVDLAGLRGRVWTRTASAGDAGVVVSVESSSFTKADLKVVAYRGADGVDVDAVATESDRGSSHTAASVTPTRDGDRVLVYWGDKSSGNTDHVLPGRLTELVETTHGSGGGYIASSVGDYIAGAAGEPTGTFTAVGNSDAGRTVMYTVALRGGSV